jgi:hypothetical protein
MGASMQNRGPFEGGLPAGGVTMWAWRETLREAR